MVTLIAWDMIFSFILIPVCFFLHNPLDGSDTLIMLIVLSVFALLGLTGGILLIKRKTLTYLFSSFYILICLGYVIFSLPNIRYFSIKEWIIFPALLLSAIFVSSALSSFKEWHKKYLKFLVSQRRAKRSRK